MPPKSRSRATIHVPVMAVQGAYPMAGGSFFGNLGRAFKKVGNFVKDNKIISTGLSFVPGPVGAIGSKVAGAVGLGRRRPKKKRVVGGAKKRAPARRVIRT